MAEYDGLPLNTPTKVSSDADIEVWATRTQNGGTVERRAVPGGPSDIARQRNARISAAVPVLRQWASDARGVTVTQGNAVATLQVVVNRLGAFFDHFADLLQSLAKDQ